MKRIYITLGQRVQNEGDNPKDKGSFVVLDWESKSVLRTVSLTGGCLVDQGRSRGASGLDFFEDFLYIATRTDLIALNPDTFEEDHRVNLPLRHIHQIKAHNNILWVSEMTRNTKMAVQGRRVVDIVPTIHSGIGSNNRPPGCFNALTWSPSGDEYHMYSGPEQIYNFTKGKVMIQGGLHGCPHDLCFLNDDELLFSRSLNKEIVKVSLKTRTMETIHKNESDSGGFTRGIKYNRNTNSIFYTIKPFSIYELDKTTWNIKDSMSCFSPSLSQEGSCNLYPFDLVLDPEDWK